MLGSKQIDKIICVACNEPIGQHSKNGLGRCLFRVQGTMVAEADQKKTEDRKSTRLNSSHVSESRMPSSA